MSTTIACDYTLEAAHFLPHVEAGHPCGRMHGHSYTIEVSVKGAVQQPSGWVMDFATLDQAMAPLLAKLDHNLLNEVPGLQNPTLEVLAAWLWQRLTDDVPGLHQIVVHETARSRCVYTGP